MKPVIYATKSFPQGTENEMPAHTAFSLNRSLLEQEDLLGVAIMVAQKFLNEPHNGTDTKKVQTALREDEEEVLKLASHIASVPDPRARKALTKRYDRLQKKISTMDLRLGQEYLALMQVESKSPLPKLLFTVGFPAGVATAMKAMSIRDWIVGVITGVVWVTAACIAYKSEINQKWKMVSNELCSSCDKESCCAKQKPERSALRTTVSLAKCYIKARTKGLTL